MFNTVRNKIITGYSVLVVLIAITLTIFTLNLGDLLDSFNFLIDHDQVVLVTTKDLEKQVVDMETGMRGYLVTGNPVFLEPLAMALYSREEIDPAEPLVISEVGQFKEDFDLVYDLVSDNPAQQDQLQDVLVAVQAWLDNVANPAVALRLEVENATGTFEVLEAQLAEGRGKEIMDGIRSVVLDMRTTVENRDSDANTSDLVLPLVEFQGTMIDMETGQRGFLMSGNEVFLEPYTQGVALLPERLLNIRLVFRGDQTLLTQVDTLERLSNQWLTEIAEPEIASRRSIDQDQANFGDVITFISSGIGKQHVDTIRAELIEFDDEENRLNAIRNDETRDLANQTVMLVLVLALVSIVISLVISFFIGNNVSRSVGELVTVADRVGEGDLSQRVSITTQDEIGDLGAAMNDMIANLEANLSTVVAKDYLESMINRYMAFVSTVSEGDLTRKLDLDEMVANGASTNDDLYQLGQNLNMMVDSLSDMAYQVRETVNTVTATVVEIQAASAQQTASTSEQSATVSQTVATVQEVRETVKQTAERAGYVAETAEKSMEVSQQGELAVQHTIEGMENIREQVESIAENILALSEKTQQIGEIIDTVNNLADQSKLLALNASIEAARAGEEGKGFAVVAMEVRQLADQSRAATARVQDILSEIQQATNAAVMVTEQGSKSTDQGMSLVESAGTAIRNLTAVIDDASVAATQIASSTSQQTNGMDQLAAAMMQIEQAAAQTASTTQQTETSVSDLLEMAEQLKLASARYQI